MVQILIQTHKDTKETRICKWNIMDQVLMKTGQQSRTIQNTTDFDNEIFLIKFVSGDVAVTDRAEWRDLL